MESLKHRASMLGTITSNFLWIPFHLSLVIDANNIQCAKTDIRCSAIENPQFTRENPFFTGYYPWIVFPKMKIPDLVHPC